MQNNAPQTYRREPLFCIRQNQNLRYEKRRCCCWLVRSLWAPPSFLLLIIQSPAIQADAPNEAAAKMQLAAGFKATVFAAEAGRAKPDRDGMGQPRPFRVAENSHMRSPARVRPEFAATAS